jgi:hypothetical protein
MITSFNLDFRYVHRVGLQSHSAVFVAFTNNAPAVNVSPYSSAGV